MFIVEEIQPIDLATIPNILIGIFNAGIILRAIWCMFFASINTGDGSNSGNLFKRAGNLILALIVVDVIYFGGLGQKIASYFGGG